MAEMFNMGLIFGMSRSKMMLKHQVLGDYFMTRFSKPKKSIILMLALIMTLSLLMLTLFGCDRDPNDYTVEEHIQMISKKVQARFMGDNSPYTSFEVYPLYNEIDEVKVYLIEFEPVGFIFVVTKEGRNGLFQNISMYRMSRNRADFLLNDGQIIGWRRFRVSYDEFPPTPFNEYGFKKRDDGFYAVDVTGDVRKFYESDANGDFVYYKKSPYAIANKLTEKLYLLGSVPCVKEGDKWFNLVSLRWHDDVSQINYDENLGVAFLAGTINDL